MTFRPASSAGIDLPHEAPDPADAQRWVETAAAHGIDGPYVLYLGRIDKSKGCGDLFADFLRWRRARGSTLKLVVAGQSFMTLTQDASIIYTGFVPDEQRNQLLAHARALVVPSRYESLSLVALEAMAHGCPVIVNRHSEVLMQHVQDSGVGAGYANFAEFCAALDATLAASTETLSEQSKRARNYVRERYAWPRIHEVLHEAIESVAPDKGAAAA